MNIFNDFALKGEYKCLQSAGDELTEIDFLLIVKCPSLI
jgi:hypothetical protein